MSTAVKSAVILALAVLLAIVLLSLINVSTRDKIVEAQMQWRLDNLSAVLPRGPYDNNPLSSQRTHIVPELGGQRPLAIYVAYRNSQPLAAVLEVVAADGYSGDIRLLVGLHVDGHVIAARVIEHRETQGLGDFIDYRRSDWMDQFNDQRFVFSSPAQWISPAWEIKRRGGEFDAVTGATVTSKAVIRSIYAAVKWFATHKQVVFEP